MGWTILLDKDDAEIGIVGDEGWDIASDFVKDFLSLYYNRFHKVASKEEIFSSIEFVYLNNVNELLDEIDNCESQVEE